MKINWIDRELKKFVEQKNILFVTAQFTNKSSDIDIYCVVKKGSKSHVHIYKKHNYWIEIFIDTWENMAQKIENYDEIVVSFISRMNLITHLSNDIYYHKALQLIKTKYKLPTKRKELLQYRIKVLASKYFSAIDSKNKDFFIGQLLPYLTLAVFEKYGIWPESPKRWIYQLERIKKPESKKILKVLDGHAKVDNLIKIFTSDFKGIHLMKDNKNNKITFLG